MKRIFGVIGLLIILFGTFLVTPSLAMSSEEVNENFEIRFISLNIKITQVYKDKRL